MIARVALTLACVLFGLAADAQEARSIAAVNAPLAYIARALGGGEIDVIYPVPSDIDPAYWRPSDDDILRIQRADLILLNGAGYAGWVKTSVLPRARLVDTSASFADRLVPSGGQSGEHKHGPEGSHEHNTDFAFTTWLDPSLAEAQMDAVAVAITNRWPDMDAEVQQRQSDLRRELGDADAVLRLYFDGLSTRQVFGSHPVYQYLDRAYLGHLQSLHWEPDADPGDAEWARLGDLLEPDRAPIMLWEGTPLPETADRLASLGVDIVVLSPMGNATGEENLFRSLAAQVE